MSKPTETVIKTRKKTRTAPGTPGASFADLGTKFKKNPKYRDKPRQKKVTMEGIDLIRQLNETIRERSPLEKALNEVGLEFSGDDMDDYEANDMGRGETPGESGEMDELVEYMRELCDTGECEDPYEAAEKAVDRLELEDEERESKIAQLVAAYNASYGDEGTDNEGTGGEETDDWDMDEDDLEAATRDDTRIDRNVPRYDPSEDFR